MSNLSWSFYSAWNDSLINRTDRILKPREHIWAGEIGGSYLDRYLKMQGTTPTNPPNARALRKFEAGNLTEWLAEMVLKRAGIFQSKQEWVEYQYPGLLRVTGKIDFLAGLDHPDYEKSRAEVNQLGLPEFFGRAVNAIITHFEEKHPDGLKDIIIEIKSSASIPFDSRERVGTPQPQHTGQIFHYLKAKDMDEGHIVYISKDDLRMLEFGVLNPSPAEDFYKKDIETMTNFIQNKIEPEKEQEIAFDQETFKFSKNWKIEYSNYLTMVYGYKTPEAFRERWEGKARQFNTLFARKVAGKKMTDLNKVWEEECRAYFPQLDDYVKMAVKKKVIVDEEIIKAL